MFQEDSMNPIFVYSFDRETFTGKYATRSEALAAALKRADGYPSPITTVYVGQRLSPNPRAFGHARAVIDRMIARVTEDIGDEADTFLRGLSDDLVTELDSALEKGIVQWLEKHKLTPRSTKVDAITEHPVPTPLQWRAPGADNDNEVHLVGETRSMQQ